MAKEQNFQGLTVTLTYTKGDRTTALQKVFSHNVIDHTKLPEEWITEEIIELKRSILEKSNDA